VEQFLNQLTNGVVLGATYGLIAIGYTMVYGIIQLINFAHGEIFMIGGFGALSAWAWAVPQGTALWIALPFMLVAGIVASAVVALLMERYAYRPLRNAPRLAPLISAIGMSIALQEAVRLWYPNAKAAIPFPKFEAGPWDLGPVTFEAGAVFVLLVAPICMVGLAVFVRATRTGRAMQATAQDPDTAKLMGINTDRIIMIAFAIGAALAAVAGLAHGIRFGQVQFNMGFIAGLKAFTAAVLGGIGNIYGAMLGGFTLGIIEVMATEYAFEPFNGAAWKNVWAFVILILVLVFRPQGLMGESVSDRA
jgi:branched-chain amino acid transport system permease protein